MPNLYVSPPFSLFFRLSHTFTSAKSAKFQICSIMNGRHNKKKERIRDWGNDSIFYIRWRRRSAMRCN